MRSEARFRRQYAILVMQTIERYFCNSVCPSVTPFDDSSASDFASSIVLACLSRVSVVKKQSELAEDVGAGFLQPSVTVETSLSLITGGAPLTSSDVACARYSFHVSGTAGGSRRLIRYRAFRKRILDNFDDDTRAFVISHPCTLHFYTIYLVDCHCLSIRSVFFF
jgi:hypothetical protein